MTVSKSNVRDTGGAQHIRSGLRCVGLKASAVAPLIAPVHLTLIWSRLRVQPPNRRWGAILFCWHSHMRTLPRARLTAIVTGKPQLVMIICLLLSALSSRMRALCSTCKDLYSCKAAWRAGVLLLLTDARPVRGKRTLHADNSAFTSTCACWLAPSLLKQC